MNPYELIMMVQQRMQKDPVFAQRFNTIINNLNSIPGLQQEVIKIINIKDPKKRQKAVDRLPSQAKQYVDELIKLINS